MQGSMIGFNVYVPLLPPMRDKHIGGFFIVVMHNQFLNATYQILKTQAYQSLHDYW